MSTKTTFKRIALVAVAALGFGVLTSVAPASAVAVAGNIHVSLDSTGVLADTSTAGAAIAGPNNYVEITQTAKASTAYNIVATGGTLVSTATTVTGSGTASIVVAENTTAVIKVPTPTAGTITIKNYAITAGVQAATATTTLTITVAAAASGTVYATTTVTQSAVGATTVANYYTSAATGVTTRYARATVDTATEVYSFTVDQKDAAGVSLGTDYTKAVTATLSGAGSLSLDGTASQAGYVAAAAGTSNSHVVNVYADGRSGTSTLTIAVNGVTVKTYDIIFWSATRASYSLVQSADYVAAGGAAQAMTVTAKDANGNKIPGATWVAASSSSAIATVTSSGTTAGCAAALCTADEFAAFGSVDATVTGVTKGDVTFTVANTVTAPTITATSSVKVTGAVIASLAWAFDKTEYAQGAKVTVTLTAKDSDGNPVGDDSYTIWGTVPTASVSVNSYISDTTKVAPTATEAFVSGVATYSFFAPVTTGEVKLSGKTAANADLAVASQGAAVSIATTVVGDGVAQAAADAAAEATDAANAATDAANAAAEAADAATAAAQDAADAVAALSTSVSAMIDALKKQITALTNLVIKIQKKVKA
jgi:hypothetical protein